MRSVAFALLAGCYHPTPPQGAPCAANGDCPAPLTCEQGVCISGSAVDAGDIDASIDAAAGTMIASNGVAPHFPAGGTSVAINGIVTFDTDTGQVTGAITRAAGVGIINAIDYHHATSGGAALGVFSFRRLDIGSSGNVRFTGAAGAVFLVSRAMTLDGKIDGTGGCIGGARACAGPGAGQGGTGAQPAGGCGAGGAGAHDLTSTSDTGGGGGGGGDTGGSGGGSTQTSTLAVGTAGVGCVPVALEPLVGGGGGGAGGGGTSGGGGGGGFQLTVFDMLTISGTITMGGAGGGGGDPASSDAAAGGAGGAGGGILVEAPTLVFDTTAIVAANGGGGGGGGYQLAAGGDGAAGDASTASAVGGSGQASIGGSGGNGGSLQAAAQPGQTSSVNGGGGGGAAGRVYFRASTISGAGSVSPAAGTGPIHTQ